MVQGFYNLDEAAQRLDMQPQELSQMAQRREVRAFADRGTWRFRTQDIEELYVAGADQVIQPEFEASVEAIRYTLTALGYGHHQIDMYTAEIRQDHYRQFLDDFKPQEVATIWEALGKQDLQWLIINARSDFIGQTLADAAIRNRTGVAVMAIRRDGATITNPEADTLLAAGDALLVMGLHDQIELLERLASPPLRS